MKDEVWITYHFYLESGIDTGFYAQLPKHSQRFSEFPYPDAGDIEQLIAVVGSALLSSSVIATAIKAWLHSRRCKITISIDGTTKKLEYEGPNIKQDAATIQAMIDKLAEESDGKPLEIIARHLPEGDQGKDKTCTN